MERALHRCPSFFAGSKFDPCRLVGQLAEPALDDRARSSHCALFDVRYVCPCARDRPCLLRLCALGPCRACGANTDLKSREGTLPSLNLLVSKIMIGKVGAKVSRSLAWNLGLLDPERRPFSLLVA